MNGAGADLDEGLERFRPYLGLLARTHLHSVSPAKLDPSDLVQQTLMDAFARREQYRGSTEAELAGWLRQILKNNMADALRGQLRDKRDIRREQSLERAIDDSFAQTHEGLAAVQSSPSQRAVREEEVLKLAECLAQLSEDQRDAVVLHHLQGWSLARLAEKLQRSEPAVAGLLHRGLTRLRELMGG